MILIDFDLWVCMRERERERERDRESLQPMAGQQTHNMLQCFFMGFPFQAFFPFSASGSHGAVTLL